MIDHPRRCHAHRAQVFLFTECSSPRFTQCSCRESNSRCALTVANDARKLMFSHSLRSLDSIPPTKNALFQHIKRALLGVAFIWKQSLSKTPEIPKPSEWGWEWNTRTKEWVPYWTDLSDVSQACSLLLHCDCSVACKGNCNWHRARLRCSRMCKCEGGCTNNDKQG